MLVALVACRREPTKVSLAPSASLSASSPSACTQTFSVSAAITGSWFGEASSAVMRPALVVRLDDFTLAPPDASRVASLEIAQPFFDMDVKLAELCSDEPAAPGMIAVKCIGEHGKVSHLVVRSAGDGLDALVDGGSPVRWQMTYAPERFKGACYALHGLGATRDLEPARAAWGRDTPSARCGNAARTRAVRVAFEFGNVPDGGRCSDNGPAGSMSLRIAMPGWRKDLGVLSNLCGGLHLTRYTDAEAIELGTSDMGTEARFAYRLGDRLYFAEGGDHIASTELACGAKVGFDAGYRGADVVEARAALR